MAGANTATVEVEDDVALSAKIKKDILYNPNMDRCRGDNREGDGENFATQDIE